MAADDFNPDLSFLHLSDIHFRRGQMGDVHDLDSDLRNELERDLRTITANRVPQLDGMIVSGDIAFSGQREEFEFGRGWIEKIRELINCPDGAIMMTPGNHDVDWKAIDADVEGLHAKIRAAENLADRDQALAGILRDATNGPKLLQSIAAYNALAKEYNCSVSCERPFWPPTLAWAPTNHRCSTPDSGRGCAMIAFGSLG